MGWMRDESKGSSTIDSENAGEAVVGYLFDTFVDPAAVALHPQTFQGGDSGVEPLPARGTAHPLNPSLKLDVYRVTCEGQTSRIEALYSNDARFVFPPPPTDPDRDSSIHYSSAVEEVKVPYPFARRLIQKEALPVGFTGPTAPVFLKYGEKYLSESQRRWSWEVIISESELDEAELAMDNQHNRLHYIRSRYWRFQAAPVEFYTKVGNEKKYRIAYTWLGDRGSNDPLGNPNQPNDFPPILPNQGPTSTYYEVYFPQQTFPAGFATSTYRMTRQPFCTFTVGKERIENGEPMPTFIQFLPYARDDFGWQSLKGI